MGGRQQFLWEILYQSAFGDKRVGRVLGETYTIRHTEHMRVDGHGCLIVNYGQDHVGGLSANTRNLYQFIEF